MLSSNTVGAGAKEVLDYLKSLSPSGVELEILSLGNFSTDELTPQQKVSFRND